MEEEYTYEQHLKAISQPAIAQKMDVIRAQDTENGGFSSHYSGLSTLYTRKIKFSPAKSGETKIATRRPEPSIEKANLESKTYSMVIVWMNQEAKVNSHRI